MNLSVEKARIKSRTIGYFDARSGNSETPANSALKQPIENSVVHLVAVTRSATYRAVPALFSTTLHNAKSFLPGKPRQCGGEGELGQVHGRFHRRIEQPRGRRGAI